jgi:hypothetical protein
MRSIRQTIPTAMLRQSKETITHSNLLAVAYAQQAQRCQAETGRASTTVAIRARSAASSTLSLAINSRIALSSKSSFNLGSRQGFSMAILIAGGDPGRFVRLSWGLDRAATTRVRVNSSFARKE